MHVTQWIQLKSFVRNEEDEETMSEMVLDSLTIQFFCHEEHISDIDLTPTCLSFFLIPSSSFPFPFFISYLPSPDKFKTPNNNNNNDNNNNHNNNNNNNNIPLTIHYQWERETPTLDVDVGLVVFFLGSFLVSSVSVVFILVEFLALEYPGQFDFFLFFFFFSFFFFYLFSFSFSLLFFLIFPDLAILTGISSLLEVKNCLFPQRLLLDFKLVSFLFFFKKMK